MPPLTISPKEKPRAGGAGEGDVQVRYCNVVSILVQDARMSQKPSIDLLTAALRYADIRTLGSQHLPCARPHRRERRGARKGRLAASPADDRCAQRQRGDARNRARV